MKKIILVIVYLIAFNSTRTFSMEKPNIYQKTIINKFRRELISIILKKLNINAIMKETFNTFYIFGTKQLEIITDLSESNAPYIHMKINSYTRLKNKYLLNTTQILNKDSF